MRNASTSGAGTLKTERSSRRENGTMLVVEDNRDDQLLIAHAFKQNG
jgi:hypothetical protein